MTKEELGGASVHTKKSGVACGSFENDIEAMASIRQFYDYLPLNFEDTTSNLNLFECTDPIDREEEVLDRIIPDDSTQAYDVRDVVRRIVDNGVMYELYKDWAKNIVIGFSRMNGQTVGIVANQPKESAGVLDVDASCKAARFVRFCDCFNIPILTFVDVPGFLPGTQQEYGGIIRHGAKLMYAYAEATVPKITTVLRKDYGGAYCVMSPSHLRGDAFYAWPSAEIAVMGAKVCFCLFSLYFYVLFVVLFVGCLYIDIQGAVEIICRGKDLEKEARAYEEKFNSPLIAAQKGYLDEIIQPRKTRQIICNDLEFFRNKELGNPRKKHGNCPL